jgi:hypothetical protein
MASVLLIVALRAPILDSLSQKPVDRAGAPDM